ncbi:MAG: flagellar protein FlgN [Bacillota bacterium]
MSPWQELMTILNNELPILDALVQIGERKRDAMLSDDLAGIDETVAQETTLLKRLQDEEGRVAQVLAKLEPLVGSHQLPDLIASPHCPCSEELKRLYEQTASLAAALQNITQQNKALIAQSLTYANLTVRAMMGKTQTPGYTATGTQTKGNPNRRLDFRA